jgi:hypothetical protein
MALGSSEPLTEMSTLHLPECKGGRRVRLTISTPSVSRLSRKCRSLDVSQTYWPDPYFIKVKLSLCLTNEALRREGVCECVYIGPYFLDLGTSWKWLVSFTPRPLYTRGKSPRYPLDRRLGEPQNRSGRRREEKIFDPTGTRTPTPRSSSP